MRHFPSPHHLMQCRWQRSLEFSEPGEARVAPVTCRLSTPLIINRASSGDNSNRHDRIWGKRAHRCLLGSFVDSPLTADASSSGSKSQPCHNGLTSSSGRSLDYRAIHTDAALQRPTLLSDRHRVQSLLSFSALARCTFVKTATKSDIMLASCRLDRRQR